MLNKVLAKVKDNVVKVVYREYEFMIPVEDITKAVKNNNVGKLIPGSQVNYKIDCFDFVEDKLVVMLSHSDIVIDKASVVGNLIDKIQKKGIGMSHIQIALDSIKEYDNNGNVIKEDMKNYIGFVKLPENLASRRKIFKSEDATFKDGKSYVKISTDSNNPATFEILSVKYGNSEEQGKLILSHGLYMHKDKFGLYTFFKKQGRYLVELESGNQIRFETIQKEDKTGLIDGWYKYVSFGASPSNERQKVIYMIDVTNGSERAHKALYDLTYGAYDLKLVGKIMSYEQLAKATSRWFQWMAPSTSMGFVKALAIYCGKFNKDKADGLAYRRSLAVSEAIEKKHGVKIDPKAICGMFEQTRDGQSKVGDIPLDCDLFEALINHLDANPLFFLREEITQEIQSLIEDGMKGKGEFAGRIVCIGSHDIKDVETLYDTNGMKSAFDFTKQTEYTLLRILRSNESNFSKSIFEKMLAKDKARTIEFVTELLVDEVFSRVEKSYLNTEPSILSPDALSKENWFMDEIIQSAFPGYLKMDRNFSLNVIDNLTKAVNKILDRFKVPMNGKNSGITVGIEVLFGIDSFIGDHEVFCPAAERMLRAEDRQEDDWKLFMIKYPSMDINEYSINKVINKAEIKKRIKSEQEKLGFSKKLMNMFIEYYMTLHDSVMVVPACELFKNKHAGSDFDTDQVAWSINKTLISILEQDEDNNTAVVIR